MMKQVDTVSVFLSVLFLVLHVKEAVSNVDVSDVSCEVDGNDDYRGCNVTWTVITGWADFSAPKYPANATGPPPLSNCECREACLENRTCVAYDWITSTKRPNCWLGYNRTAELTYDQNNTHYKIVVPCSNSTGEISSVLSIATTLASLLFIR